MRKILSGLLALALLISLCCLSAFASEAVPHNPADSGTPTDTPAETGAPANTPDAMDPVEDTEAGDTEDQTEEPPQPPDLTGGVVTGFDHERVFDRLQSEVDYFDKGNLDGLYRMQEIIDFALDCSIALPSGETVSGTCTATWNTSEIPLDVAGVYDFIAVLTPPAGCTFGADVRTSVVYRVRILDPDVPTPIIKLDNWKPHSSYPHTNAIAVELGAPIETLIDNSFFEISIYKGFGELGESYDLLVEWDFSAVDMNQKGVYTVTGRFLAPPGTYFSEGLEIPQPKVLVSVQQPGKPEINAFVLILDMLVFPMVPLPCSDEEATVWVSKNDGPWTLADPLISSTSVSFFATDFEKGNTYRIQMDYPGGQSGIVTFKVGDFLDYISYIDGDRDGSDGGGIKPPSVVQPPNPDGGDHSDSGGDSGNSGGNAGTDTRPSTPAPTPTPTATPAPNPMPTPVPTPIPTPNPLPLPELTPTPSPEPAPPAEGGAHTGAGASAPAQNTKTPPLTTPPAVQAIAPPPAKPEPPAFLEESSATSITISGLRLRAMQAEEQRLQFAKQGVSVTLSDEAAATLNLADDDVFSMEILRESDTVFSFGVLVNEKPVTAFAGTAVSLPYTPRAEAPTLTLRHEGAENVTTGSYEPQQRLATFVVDSTGTYTILEEEVPAAASPEPVEQPTPDATPVLPIALTALCLLALGGALWVWRRSAK